MKIIELLQSKSKEQVTYSLEFFPPKTPKGIETLNEKIQKISCLEEGLRPLFIDITWGAGGSTKNLTAARTLQLASQWTKITNANKNKDLIVNMHLTCKNMSTEEVDQTLHTALQNNITNIIALRGDLPKDAIIVEDDFKSGLDLLTYMKQKFANEFCVSVSGYPEGHPDAIEDINEETLRNLSDSEKLRLSIKNIASEKSSVIAAGQRAGGNDGPVAGDVATTTQQSRCAEFHARQVESRHGAKVPNNLNFSDKMSNSSHVFSGGHEKNIAYAVCKDDRYNAELTYLKRKVDAGADFIITQLFYDPYVFLAFKDRCRQIGITCPILPGIMVIYTYSGFMNMSKLCKTKVPQYVYDNVEKYKDDNEQIAKYGIFLAKEIISVLHQNGVNHFHLYTMNRDVTDIMVYIQSLHFGS